MMDASQMVAPPRAVDGTITEMRRRVGPTVKDRCLHRAVALANSMAGTSGAASPLTHISLSAVAKAAGVTRSTLYRLWPSQQEFWVELLSYMIAEATSDPAPPGQRFGGGHAPSNPEELPDAVQHLLLTDRGTLLEVGLVGHPAGSVPGGVVGQRRAERVRQLSMRLGDELDTSGRNCRAGMSVDDLAVALTLIGNGLSITGRLSQRGHLAFTSAAYTPAAGGGRSLFGALQAAVKAGLTTPREANGRAVRTALAAAPDRHVDRDAGPTGRKRDYLDIAAAMVLDAGSTDTGIDRAVRYLTLEAVARAAQVSRRTLGSLWPDQASFRLDLFAHLLCAERQDVVSCIEATRSAEATRRRQPGAEDAAREDHAVAAFVQLGDRVHQSIIQRQGELSFLAFAPYLPDAAVSERALAEHDPIVAQVRHSLDALLWLVDRRPRPGVTTEHLATALLVVCDGATRLVRTNSSLLGTAAGTPATHSLTAIVTACVLTELTQAIVVGPEVAEYSRLVS